MLRTSGPTWLALGLTTLVAAAASAAPTSTLPSTSTSTSTVMPPAVATERAVVTQPPEAFTPMAPAALIAQTLYLERCTGNCTVTGGGINDARSYTSTIPTTGPNTIAEFRGNGGTVGAAANADWNAVVQCVKEVYSPFDVQVTDVKPAAGVSFHLAIVAGSPGEVGLSNMILGIAPARGDCSPSDNVVSFSFANAHPGTTNERLLNLCWTAAQESAHAFGIPNHSWRFVSSNRSACNDPMTYRTDCGGQKFFRNEQSSCGDYAEEATCSCGPTHNSHLKLLSVFGEGTPTTGNPTSVVTLPLPNAPLAAVVGAQAGSKRGVSKVELWLNGFKWAETPGAPFGPNGQALQSSYTLTVPTTVPSSKIRLIARAYDDLGAFTDSAVVETYKGSASGCADASACADGQRCDAGYCLWDAPVGEVGDDCTYSQYCLSGLCQGTAEQTICTQSCIPGVGDSCPDGFTCIQSGVGQGVCFFPADEGGCCSVGGDGQGAWVQPVLGLGLLGLIVLRPRRRRR